MVIIIVFSRAKPLKEVDNVHILLKVLNIMPKSRAKQYHRKRVPRFYFYSPWSPII